MKILGVLFGLVVLAAVLVFWYRTYKSIKDDANTPLSSGSAKSASNSLEEFIASYKRGDAIAASPAAPAAARISQAPAAIGATAPAAPVKRDAFVSGSAKLAYLACKAGLRDHHVFAHVPLSALSMGGVNIPASTVDLLICNAAMAAVAAIDLTDMEGAAHGAAKSEYLKALGIRYLRLSAKSLPRPDELHALLYKM